MTPLRLTSTRFTLSIKSLKLLTVSSEDTFLISALAATTSHIAYVLTASGNLCGAYRSVIEGTITRKPVWTRVIG